MCLEKANKVKSLKGNFQIKAIIYSWDSVPSKCVCADPIAIAKNFYERKEILSFAYKRFRLKECQRLYFLVCNTLRILSCEGFDLELVPLPFCPESHKKITFLLERHSCQSTRTAPWSFYEMPLIGCGTMDKQQMQIYLLKEIPVLHGNRMQKHTRGPQAMLYLWQPETQDWGRCFLLCLWTLPSQGYFYTRCENTLRFWEMFPRLCQLTFFLLFLWIGTCIMHICH